MKKIVAGTALTLIALSLVATAPAIGKNDDAGAVSAFCDAHGDLGLSHGACVAFFTTRNVVPHDATVCQVEGIQSLLGVSNHGQCVKKLGEMRK